MKKLKIKFKVSGPGALMLAKKKEHSWEHSWDWKDSKLVLPSLESPHQWWEGVLSNQPLNARNKFNEKISISDRTETKKTLKDHLEKTDSKKIKTLDTCDSNS